MLISSFFRNDEKFAVIPAYTSFPPASCVCRAFSDHSSQNICLKASLPGYYAQRHSADRHRDATASCRRWSSRGLAYRRRPTFRPECARVYMPFLWRQGGQDSTFASHRFRVHGSYQNARPRPNEQKVQLVCHYALSFNISFKEPGSSTKKRSFLRIACVPASKAAFASIR